MIPGINKATRLPYRSSICDPGNRWPRVWKGIFGIRDLIEIQRGTPKKATFFERDTEFDHFQEAELAKFLARDAVLGKENLIWKRDDTRSSRCRIVFKKMSGNAGSGPPFQTLLVVFGRSFVAALR